MENNPNTQDNPVNQSVGGIAGTQPEKQMQAGRQPSPPPASNRQEFYERVLLAIGVVALLSLLMGSASLLQWAAVALLIVAIVSIARNSNNKDLSWLLHSKRSIEAGSEVSEDNTPTNTKKPITPLRVIGIILAILIITPAVLFFGTIALAIIMLIIFSIGGGETTSSS